MNVDKSIKFLKRVTWMGYSTRDLDFEIQTSGGAQEQSTVIIKDAFQKT